MSEISHAQIFERLIKLEEKVDRIDKNTQDVVKAFTAAQGAFTVLEWVAKAAKPFLWLAAGITAVGVAWQNFKSHF